jgi:SYP7 family syntaxin
MDRVNDRVSGVNTRMKETLDEVGRSSDKLIVDIICIVLAIGFAAVFYNLLK